MKMDILLLEEEKIDMAKLLEIRQKEKIIVEARKNGKLDISHILWYSWWKINEGFKE